METNINQFWSYFSAVQYDILEAYDNKDEKALMQYLKKLNLKISKIDDRLELIMSFSDCDKHTLIICIYKNNELKTIQNHLINCAPYSEYWSFQADIKPYKKKKPMGLYFKPLNLLVISDQVFIHLHKIYNTSNKLHVHVYLDLGIPGVRKYELNMLAHDMLLFYLGNANFYKHISRIKVVRRRLKTINFIPLHELKNLIEFKSPF